MDAVKSILDSFLPLYQVLVARGDDVGRWPIFVAALRDTGRVIVTEVDSTVAARQFLQDYPVAAAVVDTDLGDGISGAVFVRELSMTHPFVNTALVSELSAEDFHESTEGFGVFMKIPAMPDDQTATEFLEKLDTINALTAS